MSRILITGSKGVIGSYLTRLLTERNHEIFGVDLFHSFGEAGWEQEMSRGNSYYTRCDVSDFRQLERVFQKLGPFDFVYHTAAEFGRWNGEDYYEQLWRTNAIGTKNIIRLQELLNFKLIHFSSSEVYGDYDQLMQEKVTDNIAIKQLNDYAISKWVNELQIKNSASKYNTKTVIVRLFNTYGPGEWYHSYRGANCKFCYHALHNLPITIYKNHFRSSLFLDDACQTLSNIINNFKAGEIYNIAGTEYHNIETLVDHIWNYSGANKNLINYADSEILTTRSKKVDITKAINDLNHKITTPLEKGTKLTIDWMRGHYGIS